VSPLPPGSAYDRSQFKPDTTREIVTRELVCFIIKGDPHLGVAARFAPGPTSKIATECSAS